MPTDEWPRLGTCSAMQCRGSCKRQCCRPERAWPEDNPLSRLQAVRRCDAATNARAALRPTAAAARAVARSRAKRLIATRIRHRKASRHIRCRSTPQPRWRADASHRAWVGWPARLHEGRASAPFARRRMAASM